MAAIQPLPDQHAIRRLLSELTGRTLAVAPSGPSAPPLSPTTRPCVAAVYARDDGQVAAVMLADLSFAANVGASLTMIPPATADNAVRRGALEEMLRDNFSEIANVAASLFNRPGAPHVKLCSVLVLPVQPLTAEAKALAQKPSRRIDLDVDVPQYDSGRVALLV